MIIIYCCAERGVYARVIIGDFVYMSAVVCVTCTTDYYSIVLLKTAVNCVIGGKTLESEYHARSILQYYRRIVTVRKRVNRLRTLFIRWRLNKLTSPWIRIDVLWPPPRSNIDYNNKKYNRRSFMHARVTAASGTVTWRACYICVRDMEIDRNLRARVL